MIIETPMTMTVRVMKQKTMAVAMTVTWEEKKGEHLNPRRQE